MTREITQEDIDAIDLDNLDLPIIFHGGCHGCTQQLLNGINFCKQCCYFDADWDLENFNNAEPSHSDVVKAALKADSAKAKILNFIKGKK